MKIEEVSSSSTTTCSDVVVLEVEQHDVMMNQIGTSDVVIKKMLKNLSSQTLLSFRLVNKPWNEIATSILLERPDMKIQLVFSPEKNTYELHHPQQQQQPKQIESITQLHQKKKQQQSQIKVPSLLLDKNQQEQQQPQQSLLDKNRKDSGTQNQNDSEKTRTEKSNNFNLKNLVRCIKQSKLMFPCSHFSFNSGDFFRDGLVLESFFSLFGKQIKRLHLNLQDMDQLMFQMEFEEESSLEMDIKSLLSYLPNLVYLHIKQIPTEFWKFHPQSPTEKVKENQEGYPDQQDDDKNVHGKNSTKEDKESVKKVISFPSLQILNLDGLTSNEDNDLGFLDLILKASPNLMRTEGFQVQFLDVFIVNEKLHTVKSFNFIPSIRNLKHLTRYSHTEPQLEEFGFHLEYIYDFPDLWQRVVMALNMILYSSRFNLKRISHFHPLGFFQQLGKVPITGIEIPILKNLEDIEFGEISSSSALESQPEQQQYFSTKTTATVSIYTTSSSISRHDISNKMFPDDNTNTNSNNNLNNSNQKTSHNNSGGGGGGTNEILNDDRFEISRNFPALKKISFHFASKGKKHNHNNNYFLRRYFEDFSNVQLQTVKELELHQQICESVVEKLVWLFPNVERLSIKNVTNFQILARSIFEHFGNLLISLKLSVDAVQSTIKNNEHSFDSTITGIRERVCQQLRLKYEEAFDNKNTSTNNFNNGEEDETSYGNLSKEEEKQELDGSVVKNISEFPSIRDMKKLESLTIEFSHVPSLIELLPDVYILSRLSGIHGFDLMPLLRVKIILKDLHALNCSDERRSKCLKKFENISLYVSVIED